MVSFNTIIWLLYRKSFEFKMCLYIYILVVNFFLYQYKIILLDKHGTISIDWGAYGVPESFLIYNKKIIKKITGPIDKDLLIEIKKITK